MYNYALLSKLHQRPNTWTDRESDFYAYWDDWLLWRSKQIESKKRTQILK